MFGLTTIPEKREPLIQISVSIAFFLAFCFLVRDGLKKYVFFKPEPPKGIKIIMAI